MGGRREPGRQHPVRVHAHSRRQAEPDPQLVAELAAKGIRTVAEGRLRTVEHMRDAFDRGAHAVVVGSAPHW